MNTHAQKTGLVLEGGAMRGLFSAGVMDVWLENGLRFDGAVGVSAGACFGCNFKSRQPGRAIRYNLRYCRDKRYASVRSWLETGDVYNANFCYGDIPLRLDPFDAAAYEADPMAFYVVCTDVNTGKAVYRRLDKADNHAFLWIRASASMPLASRVVHLDGYSLLDGGIADSIPLRFMENEGYAKNVVVRTQPRGFVKEPNKLVPVMRRALRQYPAFVAAAADRHDRYNETLRYIRRQEVAGAAFVLCPDYPLGIRSVEHDPAEMQRVYDHGREVAGRELAALRAFLAG